MVITLIGTVIGYRYTYLKPPVSNEVKSYFCSSKGGDLTGSVAKTSTLSYNRTLVHYTLATFASSLAYFIFDPSKLFVPFGILHNFFEITILTSFLSGGEIRTVKQFVCLLKYLILIGAICMYLDWPYDALFF
jgi:hypothetical protein